MKKYIEIVEEVEKSIDQLDGHLQRFKKVVIVDIDGDTPQSEFSIDLASLIRAAVVNHLETPHGVLGDKFKGYVNPDLEDISVTQDKDRIMFHVERIRKEGQDGA